MQKRLIALIFGALLALPFAQFADAQIITIRVNRATGAVCVATPAGVISSKSCEDGDDGGAPPPTTPELDVPIAINEDEADIPLATASTGGTAPLTYELWTSITSAVAGFTILDADADFDGDGVYRVSGLVASTQYWVQLAAVDADLRRSGFSSVQTFTTPAPPDPPGDVTDPSIPSNVNCTSTVEFQVTCNWTASTDAVGVTSYQVNRGLGDGAGNPQGIGAIIDTLVGTPPVTTFTNVGLTEDQEYFFRFAAGDLAGNLSTKSTHEYVTVIGAPDPPPPGTSDTPDYVDPVAGVTVGAQNAVPVANNAALAGAIAAANCGDELQLAAGDYTTAQTIAEVCPANNPLTIRGAANFTSDFQATLTINGSRNIVTGLDFDAAGGRVRIGGTNNKFIANRVCCYGNTATSVAIFIVTEVGTQAEIAYNEFFSPGAWRTPEANFQNQSRIGIRTNEGGTGANMHTDAWVHHNYFHDYPNKPVPGNYSSGQSDAVEVCQTGQAAYILNMDTGWYLEYNRIDNHQGKDAIVDFKCGGLVWRYNTVSGSTNGRVDIRNGSNTIIESNYHETSGGSTAHGINHKYIGNIFPNIKLTAGNVACLGPHQTGTFHRTVCDALIESNNAALTIGDSDDGSFDVEDTIVRAHVGNITCPAGLNTNTLGACGAASIPNPTYDFTPAVELNPNQVGPDALANATAAYKAARGL